MSAIEAHAQQQKKRTSAYQASKTAEFNTDGLVQIKLKKIDELMEQSQLLKEVVTKGQYKKCPHEILKEKKQKKKEKGERWCKNCCAWVDHKEETCFTLESNKKNNPICKYEKWGKRPMNEVLNKMIGQKGRANH